MGQDKVVMALSLIRTYMVLAFLLVQAVGVTSNVTDFYCFIFAVYLKAQRVSEGAMNGYYQKRFEVCLTVRGEDRLHLFFKFVQFYAYLEFIAMDISI